MVRIALKMLLARKMRLVLTSLAVVLGTAFLTGTAVFTDTIQQTFDNLFADVFRDVDAYTRSTTVIEMDFGQEQRGHVSGDLVDTIKQVPGVEDAQPFVQQFAMIIGADGKPIGGGQGPPTFGSTANSGALGLWTFAEGRGPAGPNEVALDEDSFEDGDFQLGGPVKVTAVAGTRTFDIVGVARFGDVRSPGGATYALFDDATAAEFLNGDPDAFDAILTHGDGSVSEEELTQRINVAIANPSVETITGTQITKENQSDIKDTLSFFSVFLRVFAFIALFVATFVIYNLFSISVAQRRTENALLRAVGASRRQVSMALLIESLVIGVVGSLIGIGFGLLLAQGLKAMLAAFGVDIPAAGLTLTGSTIFTTLIIGILVTMVSALLPALRSSKVPPVAAMRAEAVEATGWSRSRLITGAIVLLVGVLATAGALFGGNIALLGPGALFLFIGLFVLGPLIARPLAGMMRRPLHRVRGMTGQLAAENAARNPKRTSRTAAALLVGAALVTAFTVMASSVKASVREIFGEQFRGDLVVNTDSFGFGGLPVALAPTLAELPEISVATGIGQAAAQPEGHGGTFVTHVDPATVTQLFDLEVLEGSIEDLDGTSIAVSKSRADRDDLVLGSSVAFTTLADRPQTLTVAAIYDKDELAGPYTVSKEVFVGSSVNLFDFSVFLVAADGVSGESAKAAIEPVVAQLAPAGEVQTRSEYISEQAAQIDPLLNLIYGLLALALIIAAIGIIITLLLSVYERRRELGLLRAVGMTRSQVRSSVRWEALIVTLLGALEGVAVGLLLGWAVIKALEDEGLSTFAVPIGSMIFIFAGAVILGIVAAIIPASRRGTKVNIVEAIAST